MVTSLSSETLASWKNFFEIATWVFALAAAFAAVFVWFAGRQLDRRRAAEEASWRDRIATSERAAQAANNEAAGLRERLRPREIPDTVETQMLNVLRRTKGSVRIVYIADPEAAVFARRLRPIIEGAGWEATEEGAMSFGPIIGLRLEFHSDETAPNYTGVLKEALEIASGPVTVRKNKNLREGALQLTVGSKPAE
jgi:hypothetical protein